MFLLRDVNIARFMMSQNICLYVCPSVCPSQASILSKRRNVLSNFFSPSGSYTILVFHTVWHGNTLRESPLTGALNAGGIKSRHFPPISRFILEMIQDRAIVTTECEY